MRYEFRWETRWRARDDGAAEWDRNLDFLVALGADGWELVSVVPRGAFGADSEMWVFKRPVAGAPSNETTRGTP